MLVTGSEDATARLVKASENLKAVKKIINHFVASPDL